MINGVPTIFEVVTGNMKKQTKEKSSAANRNGNLSKSDSKVVKTITFFYSFSLFWETKIGKVEHQIALSPLLPFFWSGRGILVNS